MKGLFHRLGRFEPDDPEGQADYWRRACKNLLKHGRPMMSPRQAQCFKAITAFIKRKGYPPTYREIASGMGQGHTAAGVWSFIQGLEERGYITRQVGRQRSITVVEFPSHNNKETKT